jgi:hypothetical protein
MDAIFESEKLKSMHNLFMNDSLNLYAMKATELRYIATMILILNESMDHYPEAGIDRLSLMSAIDKARSGLRRIHEPPQESL